MPYWRVRYMVSCQLSVSVSVSVLLSASVSMADHIRDKTGNLHPDDRRQVYSEVAKYSTDQWDSAGLWWFQKCRCCIPLVGWHAPCSMTRCILTRSAIKHIFQSGQDHVHLVTVLPPQSYLSKCRLPQIRDPISGIAALAAAGSHMSSTSNNIYNMSLVSASRLGQGEGLAWGAELHSKCLKLCNQLEAVNASTYNVMSCELTVV